MFNFMPFKNSTRIAGVMRLSDLENLRNRAMQPKARDMSVSWVKDNYQFHLLAQPKGNGVSFQLHVARGTQTTLLFQSAGTDMKALHAEIESRIGEMIESENKYKHRSAQTAAPQSDVDLPSAFQIPQPDADWVQALVQDELPESDSDENRLALLSRAFLQDAYTYISALAHKYNELAGTDGQSVTVTDMGEIQEKLGEFDGKQTYVRWRASTTHWTLSARTLGNTLEIFLVPSSEGVLLSQAETDTVRLALLQCTIGRTGIRWWNDNLPISADEMRLLVKTSFAKMVRKTLAETDKSKRDKPDNQRSEDMEKQMLAQKIISQQEQLQKQIARDLHDAVIADITVLKRGLTEEEPGKITNEDIVRSLDEISTRLREICYEMSPTDLRDWGLKTTLEALVDQAAQRSNIKCEFECPDDLPVFDGSSDLHIYRIVQEAFTNVIKYSRASEVSLKVAYDPDGLSFTIADNGKGIDFTAAMKQARQGGTGMSGMQERVGIIRSYYPATLTVHSNPGNGTVTRLVLQIGKPKPKYVKSEISMQRLKAIQMGKPSTVMVPANAKPSGLQTLMDDDEETEAHPSLTEAEAESALKKLLEEDD